MKRHDWLLSFDYGWFREFISRKYLSHMRAAAALKAQFSLAQGNEAGIQAMYETRLNNQLPVVFGEDPFLHQARAADGAANAHDFERIYEQDYQTLKDWCASQGYTPSLTDASVRDFIQYLDSFALGEDLKIGGVTMPRTRPVSLVKQMLGLEAKAAGTSGGFQPYLGSSMFYAKPESDKGDEVLGRVWFFMKKFYRGKPDADDYKRSVILAILEAAEISAKTADTHCQTRVTGELLKAIAPTLPGAKLMALITGTDSPAPTSEADIRARIDAAPLAAAGIFNRIKREGQAVQNLWRIHTEADTNPELWELYEAYYDDLYRRTKDTHGNYKNDENTLTRDNLGNSVRGFNADGTPRPAAEVEIVYYQSEFQVLEKAFTDLMKKEFEDQRGLVY
jgi:hypothetical protein